MRAELATLEARIGHPFRDRELLVRALTHRSFVHDLRSTGAEVTADNENLEFLGDSILGFLVSEALMRRYPEHREGKLSSEKARIVSAAHLHGVARRLDLGSYLVLGHGEELTGGRNKKTLLGDALEAVIAAIYLDAGIEASRQFVMTHVLDAPFAGDEESDTDIQPAIRNFKGALQELAKSRNLAQPRYIVTDETGPPHAKVFTVEVRVGAECSGQAMGRTKKIAAQRAARGVYERLLNGDGSALAQADSP
jgi:ribonuclease-3